MLSFELHNPRSIAETGVGIVKTKITTGASGGREARVDREEEVMWMDRKNVLASGLAMVDGARVEYG